MESRRKIFEIIYYFVLSGTLQAIFTPDAAAEYPSYSYFKYWIVHCGLCVVIHHLVAFKIYPTSKGILYSFGWLNLYLLTLIPINLSLSANYFYLISKPETASLLDLFGPWPYYIIVTEFLVMLFFALAYLPIFFNKKILLKTLVYRVDAKFSTPSKSFTILIIFSAIQRCIAEPDVLWC